MANHHPTHPFTSETAKAARKKVSKENILKATKAGQETSRINRLIEGQVVETVRKAMTETGSVGKKAYYEKFIDKFLQDQIDKPEGRCASMLASSIFTPQLLQKLDSERNQAMQRDIAFTRYQLSQTLFAEQKHVLEDNISKNIIIICGRRSGKTELNARLLVNKCIEPDSPCFYIHLTFSNAIQQEYDLVIKQAQQASLQIKRESRADGIIEFTNGSSIRFRGVNNEQEQQKLLGFKQKIVIIDEVQSQRGLKNLIDVIIQPLLTDYTGSQLICTGTPPRTPGTYAEVLWNNATWRKYHWNFLVNPYIPDADGSLNAICANKGITRDNSFIQREYLGVVGKYDTEAQVMKDYKVYDGDVPKDFIPDECYMGVDYGFSDSNFIVSFAVNKQQRRGYIIYEDCFNKQTITQIIDSTKKGYEKSKQFMIARNPSYNIQRINIYCDTNEESISYEMFNNYHLPAYNAYKYDKSLQLSQLSEECRTGRINIPKGGKLEEEFQRTIYKRDQMDNILPEIDDDVFHPNGIFALLYQSRQYFYDVGCDVGGEAATKWNKTNN